MNKSALQSITAAVAFVAVAGSLGFGTSHATSKVAATAPAVAQAATDQSDSRMLPQAPFDSTPITPMETVGAADR